MPVLLPDHLVPISEEKHLNHQLKPELLASFDKPGTTLGEVVSDVHCFTLPFLKNIFGVSLSVQSKEYPLSSQSFPNDTNAGVFSRSCMVTNMSKSFMCTVAHWLASIDPFAAITVEGR